ncbi:MAG TPA: hypothetical protein VK194_08810, partial [Candidatus Deferrimicrobium sp.]|nr:hypothetical protein [Candidatus Deferrimicrobium sp.]
NGPVTAEASDGMFRLELATPHGTYEPGYPIEPVASLTYLGPDASVAVRHTTSLVQFRIEEVDGPRRMGGGSRLVCASTVLRKDAPREVPFAKAGAPTTDAAEGFDQTWYEDPTLTLPVGTWRIVASIDLGVDGCVPTHQLSVSAEIHVVAANGNGPVTDQADDGVFRFELSAQRRIYAPTDAIEPVAIVTFLGPAAEMPIHRAGSIVGFEIEEVGGDNRTLYPGIAPTCASDVVRRDAPLTIPFVKSGEIGGAFDRAWFDDPALRLPVGTWRIRAYTTISSDDGPAPSDGSFTCGTRGHSLEVAVVITVRGDAGPSRVPSPPEASPPLSPAAIASPSPPTDPGPVIETAEDDEFMFDLTTPRRIYGPGDAIEPVATVRYLGPNEETTLYHAASPVGFIVEEIGGDRRMEGGMDLPCLRTPIRADRPLAYPFEKAGTTEHGFDAAWYQDPVLRLPAGTWRIRAYLDVSVTDSTATCGALNHHLEVENVIAVR